MTICFPQIVNRSLDCPREELTFSNTPPTCVRVVPVYADEAQVIGEIPPRVHFYITDDGEVYQLAPIQSPPSVPPEYHAVLDSTGCILVGVEFGTVTRGKILPIQIALLPGVLRYILVTLGLPISSIQNGLPPDRCNPQQFQQILTATQNCLLQTPPTPPDPCAFVLSCVGNSTIQVADTPTLDLTLTGNTVSGQVVVSPNPGNQLTALPNGLFVPPSTASITVTDTNTIDLTFSGGNLSADAILNPSPNNILVATPTGLFAPPAPIQTVSDTSTVDLSLSGGNLSAQVIVSPNPGNQLTALPNGLFVPPSTGGINVIDTNTVNLTLSGGNLSADVILNPSALNKIVSTPLGLFVDTVCGYNIPTTPVNGGQGLLVFRTPLGCLNDGAIDPRNVPYGDPTGTGAITQGGFYYSPAPVSVLASDQPFYFTGQGNSYVLANTTNNVLIGDGGSVTSNNLNIFGNGLFSHFASVGAYNQSSFSAPTNAVSSLIASINASFIQPSFFSNSGNYFSNVSSNGFFISLNSTFHASNVNFSNANIGNGVYISETQSTPTFSYNQSFISNRNVVIANSDIVRSFVSKAVVQIGNCFVSSSLVSIGEYFIPFGSLFVENSVLLSPNPDEVTSASIQQSFVSLTSGALMPDIAFNSIVIGDTQQALTSNQIHSGSIFVAQSNSSYSPGFSRLNDGSLTVASNSRLHKSVNYGSLFVGYQVSESPQGILEVGRNYFMSIPEWSAGGYNIGVYDAGQSLFEMWDRTLWRFRPFNDFTSYPSNAAAIGALSLAYSTDPRLKVGQLVVVNVAGTPAIFAWNGSAFVRITV